jgi:HKD family nuclease
MELILKIDKKQLKIFTELADTLNVKHYIVSEESEDAAIVNAMDLADNTLLNVEESTNFENWLRE